MQQTRRRGRGATSTRRGGAFLSASARGEPVKWTAPDQTEYFVAIHPDVYVPHHDTFLLAQAVAAEVKPGERVLEVGGGAGLVSLVAAHAGGIVTCTDLNPHAVALVRSNAYENQLSVKAVEADLLAGVAGPFDVVAFNPPYLPTTPDEVVPGPLNLAFDGGIDGNGTVLRFAAQLAAAPWRARAILVVHSSLSDPAPLDAALKGLGYQMDTPVSEAHFFERLTVRRYRLHPAT